MHRLSTPVKRTASAKALTTITRLQRKFKKDQAFKQRLLLILAAALIGLMFASIRAINISQSNPINQPATQQVTINPASGPSQDQPLFAQYPTWSQDFSSQNSGLLDPKYWNVLVGPALNSNNEQQYYSDHLANLSISNGALHLTATHESEPGGYKYGSARIESQGKQTFLYGRIDITAKLPAGNGTWPAVWMLPDNDVYERKSPATDPLRYKNGGEIDILEAVGFERDHIYGVAHTAADVSNHPDGTGSYAVANVQNSTTQYATYTLLWTPTSLTFAVNGTPFYTYSRPANSDYTTWPFDQPFYLIANLAIGGSWGGVHGIDPSALPASLDIQSMYYYPYVGK